MCLWVELCNEGAWLVTALMNAALVRVFPVRQRPEEMEATGSGSGAEAEDAQNHTAMLWSIQEAVQRQTLQIGASACGATAVVDVLQALGITVTPETVDHCVRTSLRRNEAPLHDYLHSRSKAGTAALYWVRCSEPVLLKPQTAALPRCI